MDWQEISNGTLATVFGGLILSGLATFRVWLFRDNGVRLAKFSVLPALLLCIANIRGIAPFTANYTLDLLHSVTIATIFVVVAIATRSMAVRAFLAVAPVLLGSFVCYAGSELAMSTTGMLSVFATVFPVFTILGLVAYAVEVMRAAHNPDDATE
jgi:hypothetical protein